MMRLQHNCGAPDHSFTVADPLCTLASSSEVSSEFQAVNAVEMGSGCGTSSDKRTANCARIVARMLHWPRSDRVGDVGMGGLGFRVLGLGLRV